MRTAFLLLFAIVSADPELKCTVTYDNRVTGATEVHKVANIGMVNTPVIFNISIGYAFHLP